MRLVYYENCYENSSSRLIFCMLALSRSGLVRVLPKSMTYCTRPAGAAALTPAIYPHTQLHPHHHRLYQSTAPEPALVSEAKVAQISAHVTALHIVRRTSGAQVDRSHTHRMQVVTFFPPRCAVCVCLAYGILSRANLVTIAPALCACTLSVMLAVLCVYPSTSAVISSSTRHTSVYHLCSLSYPCLAEAATTSAPHAHAPRSPR